MDTELQEMSLIDRVKSYACSAAVLRAPWLELLMADVIHALAAQEWQDISTAPKDGTCILGCWKTDVMDVIFWSPGGRGGREWCNDDGFLSTPLYWQPLPAGPLIAEERGSQT